MNKLNQEELRDHSIYRLYDFDIDINGVNTSVVYSLSDHNDRFEISITNRFAEKFNLKENDLVRIDTEQFIVKDVFAPLNQIVEAEVFFSEKYVLEGQEVNGYFAVDHPTEADFKFIYKSDIFSGLIFEGNDEISYAINMLKVYQIGILIMNIFLGLSSVIIGYLYSTSNQSSMNRVLYILSNIGLNQKTVNRFARNNQKIVFVLSFVLALFAYGLYVKLINDYFISSYEIDFQIIQWLLLSFMSTLSVCIIGYVASNFAKVKVTNFY